jgi:DNA-binding LacI/PurR family transcriptional regulator
MGRGAEGLITIDTALIHELRLPVVVVAGHRKIPGVTNVILDHKRAAELSLRHLLARCHRRVCS